MWRPHPRTGQVSLVAHAGRECERARDCLSQVDEHEDVGEDDQKGGTVQQRCRGFVHDRVGCDQRLDKDDQHGEDQ